MGGKTSVPQATAEERALQQSQAELLDLQRSILEQQRAQQAVLLPFLAEQEGYDIETDENGNITNISKVPDPLDAQRKELEAGLLDRSLAALKGELPVSPALEQDLARQEESLRERLSQQFGPGFETSSPGIETLGQFFNSSEGLREGARTAQLTLSEQLGMARQQQNDFSRQTSQDFLRQISLGDQLGIAGAFGQTAAGYGNAQGPYLAQRQLQTQVGMSNASNRAQVIGAGIGAIGSIFSDETLKSNAEIISIHPSGVPIYEFTMGGERRIGVFAGDVEEVAPGLVGRRAGYKTVQYEDL